MSNSGSSRSRLSSTLMMCQPNCDLDRIGQRALVELERHFGEFRHHLVLGEVAEIAAVGRARVLRLRLGQLGEIRALLELGEHRLRLVLGLHQDVARAHLLLLLHLPEGLVIDLAHRRVGHRGLGLSLQELLHQQLGAHECEPPLELVAVRHLLRLGGLGDQHHVGHEGDQVVALRLGGICGMLPPSSSSAIARSLCTDFRAVDLRDHRVVLRESGTARRRA